jgi:hypothetical protein
MELFSEVFNKFPVTCMSLLAVIILAIAYRLIRYGLKIKAGPIEIDADNVDEKKTEEKEVQKDSPKDVKNE